MLPIHDFRYSSVSIHSYKKIANNGILTNSVDNGILTNSVCALCHNKISYAETAIKKGG